MKYWKCLTALVFLVVSGFAGCASTWHPGCNCGTGGGYSGAGGTYEAPVFGSPPANGSFASPPSGSGYQGSGGR